MMINYEIFHERITTLQKAMADASLAAGRDPKETVLLPVTKTHPATAADYARQCGFAAVGENRVQEAAAKRAELEAAPPNTFARLHWELIGHLQSNKARLAVATFDRVQSVDSPKLAQHLARAAAELGRPLPILLQINSGHDPAKFGAEPDDAPALLDAALALPSLRVDGLMAIAPLGATPHETSELARRTFARLREIRDELARRSGLPLRELSMGMSGDFAEAIAEGSTLIRVGTALFGPRN